MNRENNEDTFGLTLARNDRLKPALSVVETPDKEHYRLEFESSLGDRRDPAFQFVTPDAFDGAIDISRNLGTGAGVRLSHRITGISVVASAFERRRLAKLYSTLSPNRLPTMRSVSK